MFDLLKKIIVSDDDFELQATNVSGDMTAVSLVEFENFEPVSTTEVYLSSEELRECIDGLTYILERIEREGGCV